MPINKFGAHFLNDSGSSSSAATTNVVISNPTSPFYICTPSLFHSKCYISIFGEVKITNKDFYTLQSSGVIEFIVPISGKIEDIDKPFNVHILLNSQPKTINDLKGTYINKGDKIKFKTGMPRTMFLSFIIQCPLEKNE